MNRLALLILGLIGLLTITPTVHGQARPYLGFVYPAGGQQGTTFQIRVGGQNLDEVDEAIVSGKGVSARIVDYRRKLGPQELALLREQLNELKGIPPKKKPGEDKTPKKAPEMMAAAMMMQTPTADGKGVPAVADPTTRMLIEKLETRIAEYTQRPACNSIATIVIVEVTMDCAAEPGQRELVLATPHGASNPLVFHVGQLPEVSRKPMVTAEYQVLGKEELALRKRLVKDEKEERITLPSVLNGQIASGEVNRYRFDAKKGQRLVIAAQARQLVPYIADAVPGWFQPIMTLCNARGKEVAYSDDYRFRPDPVILYQVPEDGEYTLQITDAIYRGREDFVYRVSLGELPFVTSIFPLGGPVGQTTTIQLNGWNLQSATLTPPRSDARPGVQFITAWQGELASNRLPFELGTLPECLEKEPNDDVPHAQQVNLPIIINGRSDRRGDCDVFQFSGRAGDTVVAEVSARRLDSPLDSLLKLTDANGNLLALNDDYETPEFGVNTHHADSYLTAKLPADGVYRIHLSDLARDGGEEYAYRLRISAPQPDFALYAVPSSVAIRGKAAGAVSVYAIRKDGFAGPIKLRWKDSPDGFSSSPFTLAPNQATAKFSLKTTRTDTEHPVDLLVEGVAKIGDRDVVHAAVPAEDKMQAFLWRHLVPAEELKIMVVDPAYQSRMKRASRSVKPPANPTPPPTAIVDPAAPKPKFTKQQVAGRLKQLMLLFDDGLLTEGFYARKVAECEAGF